MRQARQAARSPENQEAEPRGTMLAIPLIRPLLTFVLPAVAVPALLISLVPATTVQALVRHAHPALQRKMMALVSLPEVYHHCCQRKPLATALLPPAALPTASPYRLHQYYRPAYASARPHALKEQPANPHHLASQEIASVLQSLTFFLMAQESA